MIHLASASAVLVERIAALDVMRKRGRWQLFNGRGDPIKNAASRIPVGLARKAALDQTAGVPNIAFAMDGGAPVSTEWMRQ